MNHVILQRTLAPVLHVPVQLKTRLLCLKCAAAQACDVSPCQGCSHTSRALNRCHIVFENCLKIEVVDLRLPAAELWGCSTIVLFQIYLLLCASALRAIPSARSVWNAFAQRF